MFGFKSIVLLFYLLRFSLSESLIDADFSLMREHDISGKRFKRAALLKKGGNPNECNINVCKTTTAKMLVAMEHSADACEEFYELVCGKQVKKNGFTSDNYLTLADYLNTKIAYNSEKYLQDFKRFYDSCVHYTLDFFYLNSLDFIKIPTSADITEVFAEAILTQSMPFFDIGLDIAADDRNYQLVLTLPGVHFLKTNTEGWSVFEECEQECLKVVQNSVGPKKVDLDEMYTQYLTCKNHLLLEYVQEFEDVMKITNTTIANEGYLQDVLELHKKLAVDEEIIRTIQHSKIFTPMEINELTSKYGIIDWKVFFEKITNNKTFVGNEKVLVIFPDHFRLVFEELGKVDKDKLINMFQEFTRFQLYRNIVSPRHTTNRELYCMSLAHEVMPDIVSTILYDLSPTKKIFLSVYQANKMFSDLKDALGKSIQESVLDDMSKEKFGKKLELLNLGLITSGDNNNTRDNYRNVKVRADYQENIMILLKNYRKFIFGVTGSKSSPATLLNFFVSPFSTRPTTFYTSDSIVLHPEIFKVVPSGIPEHIRLARLGFFLAQELTKHFDPTGRLFMTNNIRSNDNYYADLVKHTNELFDTYYTKTPFVFNESLLKFKPVNGKLFANELISDNAAFRLVTDYFHTLKKPKELPWIVNGSITHNQSFFISFAQEFCDDQTEASFMRDLYEKRRLPLQIKIRNIISNSVFFADTFNCLEGSSLWLDPSVIRQFPHAPIDDYGDQSTSEEGQYQT